jgi:hypothetical protein
MEIALLGFILYASTVLIWCSLSKASVEHVVISPALVRQWSGLRSDMLVFQLHPDGQFPPPPTSAGDVLTATPTSLKNLLAWIPPGSTLVLCNCGLSSRSVKLIEQRLTLRNLSRIYWIDELPTEILSDTSGTDPLGL